MKNVNQAEETQGLASQQANDLASQQANDLASRQANNIASRHSDTLYRNKYRIKSARAPWWDYCNNGLYFITICTQYHQEIFGIIRNGTMHLSSLGELVSQELYRSFEIRSELIHHSSVIMPNHIHLIVEIRNNGDIGNGRDARPCVSTGKWPCVSTDVDKSINTGVAYRLPKSISTFVSGFKSSVTIQYHRSNNTNKTIWQPRFHDHIIRDYHEYDRIRTYIDTNPMKWEQDRFHTNQ